MANGQQSHTQGSKTGEEAKQTKKSSGHWLVRTTPEWLLAPSLMVPNETRRSSTGVHIQWKNLDQGFLIDIDHIQ